MNMIKKIQSESFIQNRYNSCCVGQHFKVCKLAFDSVTVKSMMSRAFLNSIYYFPGGG
jgi:hypothetical protein